MNGLGAEEIFARVVNSGPQGGTGRAEGVSYSYC
jgi:hypothetical protein